MDKLLGSLSSDLKKGIPAYVVKEKIDELMVSYDVLLDAGKRPEDRYRGNSQTPRSVYSRKQRRKAKGMVNLLLQLDVESITNLKREFKCRRWEVAIYDFVLIIQATLTNVA